MPPKENKSQKEAAHQNQPKQKKKKQQKKKKKQQNKPPKNVKFYCYRPGCNREFRCSESEHLFYVHSAAAPVNMSKKKKPKPFHCSQCEPNPRYFCSAPSLNNHIKDVHDKKKKKKQSK